MRRVNIAVLASTTLLALAAGSLAWPTLAIAAATSTIETTGSATLTVPNDTAQFQAGLSRTRATPVAALDATGAATRRVIAAVEAAGVTAADIQTSTLTVRPVTRKLHGRRVHRYASGSTLSVTVTDVHAVGRALQAAAAAGATSLQGPSFFLSNQEAVYQRALAQAFDQARAKAEALATEAGLTLGPAEQIQETSGSTPPPFATGSSSTSSAAPTATPPPTKPGTTQVVADVDVVFDAS